MIEITDEFQYKMAKEELEDGVRLVLWAQDTKVRYLFHATAAVYGSYVYNCVCVCLCACVCLCVFVHLFVRVSAYVIALAGGAGSIMSLEHFL